MLDTQIIILAAGKGSRMNSVTPKVMHDVGGIPMLEHVVRNCNAITKDLILVYSQHLVPYLNMFTDRCVTVNQEEQLGTAHAVYVAKDLFNNNKNIGVIYGDNPLITPEIINGLFSHLEETNSKVVTLAFEYNKPNHYGRIVLGQNGDFKRIVETKSANEEEKKITLCNSGIMAFSKCILSKYIDKCILVESEQGKELYLTNIIEVCASAGEHVSYYKSSEHQLVLGVNTQEELRNANSIVYKKC